MASLLARLRDSEDRIDRHRLVHDRVEVTRSCHPAITLRAVACDDTFTSDVAAAEQREHDHHRYQQIEGQLDVPPSECRGVFHGFHS